MKTFDVISGQIMVDPFQKTLSVRGNNHAEQVCFRLERFQQSIDLSELECVIKTRSHNGIADMVLPTVTVNANDTCDIFWTVASSATMANGLLDVQLEFHQAGTDDTRVVWQTCIAEFFVEDGLPSDAVFEPSDPTILQQWEQRITAIQADVSQKYNEVKGSIDTINAVSNDLEVGMQQLAEMSVRLDSGLATIDGVSAEFQSGLDELSTVSAEFRTGLSTLQVGIDTVTALNSGFTTGITEVNELKADIQTVIDNLPNITLPTAYRGTASYQGGFFNLNITGIPSALPENFSVTFTAPANFTAGDKLRINGVEHVVNLYGKGFNNPSNQFTGYKATGLMNGYAKFHKASGTETIDVTSIKNAATKLSPNTQYTVFADVLENSLSGQLSLIAGAANIDPWMTTSDTRLSQATPLGVFKKVITTAANVQNTHLIRMYQRTDCTGSIMFRIMLLEGNMTAKTLPARYWEGTYGEYDIRHYVGDATSGAFLRGQPITLTIGLTGAFLG